MRYVDNRGHVTETYLQSERLAAGRHRAHHADGRFTIVMPHPERVFRNVQLSWSPDRSAEIRPGCASFATRESGCN